MARVLRLPERLLAVAEFIEKGAAVADIGTDHGYLPVYLAQNGLARFIIASDISAGSLKSALRSATDYGVADKITFIAAPGLQGVSDTEVDTVVVAGLGGETIADILISSPWTKNRDARLILQPQSKKIELCAFLLENGYCLLDARLACDNNRFYVVLLVKGGKSDSMLAPEAELLARLVYRRDPLFLDYLDDLSVKTNRALSGMKKSGAPGIINMLMKLALYDALKEEYENANGK